MHYFGSFWTIVLFCVLNSVNGLRTVYFSELCPFRDTTYSKIVALESPSSGRESSAILKAKKYFSFPTGVVCSVTIRPPNNHGVVAAIRKINLQTSCSDNITIYNPSPTVFCGSQHDSTEQRSLSSSGELTLIFKTSRSGSGSTLSQDFQITVTSTKVKPCMSSRLFGCANSHCIAKELLCDGHNHCGDRSDQEKCGLKSVAGIVGAVFGSLFILIAIIAGTVFCCRSRRRRITTRIVNRPPTTNQPVYPPYSPSTTYQGRYPPPPRQY